MAYPRNIELLNLENILLLKLKSFANDYGLRFVTVIVKQQTLMNSGKNNVS